MLFCLAYEDDTADTRVRLPKKTIAVAIALLVGGIVLLSVGIDRYFSDSGQS